MTRRSRYPKRRFVLDIESIAPGPQPGMMVAELCKPKRRAPWQVVSRQFRPVEPSELRLTWQDVHGDAPPPSNITFDLPFLTSKGYNAI